MVRVVRDAGGGRARGRFTLICEGWLPHDGAASRRGRGLESSAPAGAGAHSRSAGPVWRAPAATGSSNGLCGERSVGQAGDLPDKAGELAGDGDRDGGPFLYGARTPATSRPCRRTTGRATTP